MIETFHGRTRADAARHYDLRLEVLTGARESDQAWLRFLDRHPWLCIVRLPRVKCLTTDEPRMILYRHSDRQSYIPISQQPSLMFHAKVLLTVMDWIQWGVVPILRGVGQVVDTDKWACLAWNPWFVVISWASGLWSSRWTTAKALSVYGGC